LQAERLNKRAEGGDERLESAGERGKLIFQLDKICTELSVVPSQTAPDESDILSAIQEKVTSVLSGIPAELLTNPPLAISATTGSKCSADAPISLTAQQSEYLEVVNEAYIEDFRLRRRMLMKRLDVTIQSFLWGEAAQGKEGEIVAAIQAHRRHLSEEPHHYTVMDALTAPVSLLHEHCKRVTDASGKSLVKTVIIGKVPDRGGRANEMRPKKADVFGFGGGGGRGGGGGGGGRGGGGGGRGGGNKQNKGKGKGKGKDHGGNGDK
jgi:protein FAM98B